ncbi:MAG TPA: hypothetical protein VFW62_02835 [bacterium]|nr:hypothetical protein [bacterium]
MKRWITSLALAASLSIGAAPAYADFNLINVDLGSPEAQRANDLYGQAYGFQPVQVAPVMAAPAEEVPAILQMAQAAGTLPVSVWMLRQAGMNYGQIMQSFAMAPMAGFTQPMTDVYYIQRARQSFLLDRLRVDPYFLPSIPLRGPEFTRFIVYPVHPKIGYWMPPGQAKKYGLWIPPGQAKKMGLWDGRWSHDRWRSWDWDERDVKDWDGPDWKGKDWKDGGKSMSGKPDKGDKGGSYKNANSGNGGHGKGSKEKGNGNGGGKGGKSGGGKGKGKH